MKIFLCQDSIDGIFTGIYNAWESKLGHENVKVDIDENTNMELFCEYIKVETDTQKSLKVSRTINNRMGYDCYADICQAALSNSEGKADAIYRVLILAFSLGNPKKVMDYLSNPFVLKVFELSRAVGNEAHHYLGFVRFKELHNGVLFSTIAPKNNIVTLISSHFCDRLPCENWMIHDEIRGITMVHQENCAPVLVTGKELDLNQVSKVSDSELELQELWKAFCKSISIEGRKNLDLQQQNLPDRFRNHMVEFR